MSEKQARTKAINQFVAALREDSAMCNKFRAAFPQFAERLLDREGELSMEDLEAVAGGVIQTIGGARIELVKGAL